MSEHVNGPIFIVLDQWDSKRSSGPPGGPRFWFDLTQDEYRWNVDRPEGPGDQFEDHCIKAFNIIMKVQYFIKVFQPSNVSPELINA